MDKKYQIIYADPPWETKYFKENREGQLSRRLPYTIMSDNQIIKLPIKNIVADDAILFLWCIDSRIPLLSMLMLGWGFDYKCIGFVWCKAARTTNGENATYGSYTRRSCEYCFIGTKGKYLVKSRNVDQFLSEPKSKHSKKPIEIKNRIIKLVGDLPRIELFARKEDLLFDADGFEGWDVWGNEVDSDIELSKKDFADEDRSMP